MRLQDVRPQGWHVPPRHRDSAQPLLQWRERSGSELARIRRRRTLAPSIQEDAALLAQFLLRTARHGLRGTDRSRCRETAGQRGATQEWQRSDAGDFPGPSLSPVPPRDQFRVPGSSSLSQGVFLGFSARTATCVRSVLGGMFRPNWDRERYCMGGPAPRLGYFPHLPWVRHQASGHAPSGQCEPTNVCRGGHPTCRSSQ